MPKLHLIVEKDGVTRTRDFNLSGLGLAKAVKEIRKLLNEKWNLIGAESGNKELEEFLQKQIQDYNADREHYHASLQEIVKLGAKIAKG